MAEINNLYSLPVVRPTDQPQQRPAGREQQQDRFQQQAQSAKNTLQQPGKAPLNVLPSEEALDRLITRAQDAQNQGKTLERGSILNLVI